MDFCTRILKSLCGYITARPPITIFVLCIGGIAMSFIILSYHIENHNAINYEASKEYVGMLKRFGDISFCLTQNTTQLSASERASVLLQHGFTEFVNITAPIKVTFKLQGNLTSKKSISELTGIIPYFYVFSGDDHVHSLIMHAFLHSPLNPDDCKEKELHVDTCVVLTVKKSAIPSELPDNKCVPTALIGNYTKVHMAAVSTSNKESKSLCTKGLGMNIIQDKNAYKPVVYLNLLDKAKVQLRLNVLSYALFIFLVAAVLYAIMRGSTISATKTNQR